MRKYLFIVLLFFSALGFTQSGGITYQAVIYNPNGEQLPGVNNPYAPLINKNICLRFNILDQVGAIEYQEQVNVLTDDFGMVNILIGNSSQSGGYANGFNDIIWNSNTKSLKVELDSYGGCTNFEELSNQPFTYVPFAYYSANEGERGPAGADGNGIESTLDNADGTFTFTYTDGTTFTTSDLTGPEGADGLTAYEVWLSEGNTGTEQDFLNSLTGPAGADGFIPDGTAIGNTTFWDGAKWVVDSNHLYNDGTNVMIGTTTIDTTAALNISSNDKGILIPRLTMVERDAIPSPTTSLLIFQTDNTPGFYYFDGNVWKGLIQTNTTGSSSSESLLYTVTGF